MITLGFPSGTLVKNPPANAGDTGLIPGLGRSPGEGNGFPLPYSWAFLVAQMVKNLPAKQETWVRSLGWEDPLEELKWTDYLPTSAFWPSPKSKHLFISWLQSPSSVILEPPKIKSLTVSIVSPSICYEVIGPDAVI